MFEACFKFAVLNFARFANFNALSDDAKLALWGDEVRADLLVVAPSD